MKPHPIPRAAIPNPSGRLRATGLAAPLLRLGPVAPLHRKPPRAPRWPRHDSRELPVHFFLPIRREYRRNRAGTTSGELVAPSAIACRWCRSALSDHSTGFVGARRVDPHRPGSRKPLPRPQPRAPPRLRRRSSPASTLHGRSGHHEPLVRLSTFSRTFCARFGML